MAKNTARRVAHSLGLRVIELRHELSLTQEALAERLRWAPRQVQRIEAGEGNPTLESMVKLANALGVQPQALLQPPERAVRRRVGRPAKR